MKILDTSFFVSKSTSRALDQSYKDFKFSKTLPPIASSEEVVQQVTTATQTAGQVFQLVSSSNLFVGIILGGSMQLLWGLIRSLQLFILSTLIQIPFPSSAFTFFNVCMAFASLDVFSGEKLYNLILDFTPTEPISDNFD